MEKLLKTLIVPFGLLSLCIGCENSADNNQGMEYETLDVNFKGSLTGASWTEGSEIGIFALCTRDETQGTPMSANKNAKFTATAQAEKSNLKKNSDNDAVIARNDDHNFKFFAYYPYSSSVTDMTAIDVAVPASQSYSAGVMAYSTFVASKSLSSVIATVELDFQSVFSIIELHVPNDILDEDGNSIVKTVTLKPAVADNFTGALAKNGKYNLETGTFTPNTSGQSKEIVVDFGAEGLALSDAYTKVSLAVAPFTIPEGGMEVVVAGLLAGEDNTITIWNKEEDEGTSVAAGEVKLIYLSSSPDGVIPVTFPVVFPVGYENGAYVFSSITQPQWLTEAKWICPTQTQAYAEWTFAPPLPTFTYTNRRIEFVNSGNNIGSPGMKGIWTGDYMEFALPVRKFAEGTEVTIKFPFYTRQGPIFWNIEYWDEEQWKCNKQNLKSYDEGHTMDCTFAITHGNDPTANSGCIVEHTMTFTEAIQSGLLKIRIVCADGSVQANSVTATAKRTEPWSDATGYNAPFYFLSSNPDVKSVTFSIN